MSELVVPRWEWKTEDLTKGVLGVRLWVAC